MSRPLIRVPVPPGAEGAMRLLPDLVAALDGSGAAIAPVPAVSPTVSHDYVMSLLRAVLPGDSSMPLESDEVCLVLATSGSTGAPRGVLLTTPQLTHSTAVINGTGGSPQWVLALPVTSMGGMNVLVRALGAGREPMVVPSIGGAGPFTPAAFARSVERATAVTDDVRTSLVPAQMARLLGDEAGIEALTRCALVLVGGAPTRPSLLDAARGFGIPVTTTYGATETAGGCVLDGSPLPGVSVRADGTPGRLTISGPCVALGYRGEPELTRLAFTPDGFRTSDLGEVSADGTVRVLGRIDDVVIVRGVNVSPLAIENLVSDLPDVEAAAAVVISGPDGEPVVHVFIEARDGAPTVADRVRESTVSELGRAARPAVHVLPRLPHLANGKVDRPALRVLAEEG